MPTPVALHFSGLIASIFSAIDNNYLTISIAANLKYLGLDIFRPASVFRVWIF